MGNLFSDLESFGLGNLKNVDIYEGDSTDESAQNKEQKHQISEVDVIFDKTYTCPVCDKEFKSKTIKTGKIKLLGADTDLRPKYQLADSLKYDAIICPKCGYAALTRFFNHITSSQVKLVKEQISSKFNGLEEKGDIYSYDEAITRHKLALVNTIVKKGRDSEKAYVCLKIAWLLRGKAEELPKDTPDYEKVMDNLKKEEKEFLLNAYEGFNKAFSKEMFPMCGMDELTTTYLVGDLARRCGKYDEAGRWISKVLVSREANERIKSKAREVKELIKEHS